MHPIQIKFQNGSIVSFQEPTDANKSLIEGAISGFKKSGDKNTGIYSVFTLFRATLVSIQSPNTYALFDESEDSNHALMVLAKTNDSPMVKTLIAISYQVACGSRSDFHDSNGNPLEGITVLKNLTLLN